MCDPDHVPLTSIPSELIRGGLIRHPVKPRSLWDLAVSGAFPAQQARNGRWSVKRSDLPLVAAALGARPAEAVAA